MLTFLLPGLQVVRHTLGRQWHLLAIVVVLGLGSAILEGTGIGLAIVRKAVERMGGKVGVQSDGKSGSRFWLELSVATQPRA